MYQQNNEKRKSSYKRAEVQKTSDLKERSCEEDGEAYRNSEGGVKWVYLWVLCSQRKRQTAVLWLLS